MGSEQWAVGSEQFTIHHFFEFLRVPSVPILATGIIGDFSPCRDHFVAASGISPCHPYFPLFISQENKLEEAQESLKRARALAKDKVDATEASLLTGVVVGSVAHGYARGMGYTEIAGFDVGLVLGAGALVAAQMLPRGSHQRSLAMGVGAGMTAAVISEYAEGFAMEAK